MKRGALAILGMAAGLGLGLAGCAGPAQVEPKSAAAPSTSGTAAAATAQASGGATGPAGAPDALTPVIAPLASASLSPFARRLATAIDGARPQVTTFPLDLASLPQVTMHARLDAKAAAKLDRSKLVEETDLFGKPADGYARQYMMSFGFKDSAKVQFAHLRIQGTYGPTEGWFGDGFGNAVTTYATCGTTGEPMPVQWETLEIREGKATYTVSDGVLDRQSCKILLVKRSTAVAKPLLPKGILFGFRACEGSCAESEELTVLFPRATAAAAGALGGGADKTTGSFSMVSFPLQTGGGGAFVARIMRRDVSAWQLQSAGLDGPNKTLPVVDEAAQMTALFLPSFELGVEVSQAHGDPAPVAIAYLDIDPATLPSPASRAASPPGPVPSVAPSRFGFGALDSRN